MDSSGGLDILVDRWLEKADYLAQTKQQHLQAYRELRAFVGGNREPGQVTAQLALEYVEQSIKQSGSSYATQRRKLNSLVAFWEWMASQRVVPKGLNPWRGYRLASKKAAATPTRRKRPYTEAELLKLFDRRPAYDGLADVMVLGLVTGMRLDEICALVRSDVEPDEGGYWMEIRRAKTRAGVRKVFVSHAIGSRILARRLAASCPQGSQLFPEFRPGGYDGKLSWAVSKAFGRHRSKCGLSGETDFHSFRRTFITLMENAGVDQVRIARYVGHELPTLAFAVYSGGSTERTVRETAASVSYSPLIEQQLVRFLD